MISLDEQIEWCEAAINAPLLEVMKVPLSAILATLRSAKASQRAEPAAYVDTIYESRYTLLWNGRSLPQGTPLYAAPQPVAAPDGCVVVPKEPTNAMLLGLLQQTEFGEGDVDWILDSYNAMLAAAPAAPQSHEADVINGCTDGACIFGGPKGMHTNGGCNCMKTLKRNPQTAVLVKRIMALMQEKTASPGRDG